MVIKKAIRSLSYPNELRHRGHGFAVCNVPKGDCHNQNATIPYLKERKLPEWVHRKTIQKAIESYRITPEQKVYLKTLRK